MPGDRKRYFVSMGKRFEVKAVFYYSNDSELAEINDYLSDFDDRGVIQDQDGEVIIALKKAA